MEKSQIINLLAIMAIVGGAGFLVYQSFFNKQFDVPKPGSEEAQQVKHSIPLDEIYDGGPGKDGIPSIDNPKFISISEAKSEFQDSGLGLVVDLNGEQRFYPYQILVWHELVNDQIGATPVLVSFCPLCGSGLVFERTLDGTAVEFGVSGKLHNSDLLMYDRKTDSLWAQILGEAVVGERTGEKLRQLRSSVVTFEQFTDSFPNGQVLSKDTGFSRNYETGPYGNYDNNDQLLFPVAAQSQSLPPKTRVLGVAVNDLFKAYPLDTLASAGNIEDQVGETTITLSYDNGLVTIINQDSGEQIIPVNTFWFGWFAFHPNTMLYQ